MHGHCARVSVRCSHQQTNPIMRLAAKTALAVHTVPMMMPALAACGAACAALLYLRALQQPRSAITRLGGAAASSPFSHVVIHGGVAYLSGVTAQADGNGLTDKDTVEEQTRRTLAVIEQRLALAGTDKSRLLSCQSALAAALPLAPALQAEKPPLLAPSLAQRHRSRLQGDERRVERVG